MTDEEKKAVLEAMGCSFATEDTVSGPQHLFIGVSNYPLSADPDLSRLVERAWRFYIGEEHD
jgi:hypothetical protein